MTTAGATERPRVADVIETYGGCLELVPMDPQFHGISVGLYVKDGTCTVWTFSRKQGAQNRVREVRGQLVALGGLTPVEGTHNQARFPCGYLHLRLMKLLLAQAVGGRPGNPPAEGRMSIKDTKSALTLSVAGRQAETGWVYQVSGGGEAPNVAARLRAVAAGFVRYGEMERVDETEVTFPCGRRHDELAGLLLPYSRNAIAAEGTMEAGALRGQMTTSTLGFTPT